MDHGFLAAISKEIHEPLTGTNLAIYPSLLGSLKYAAVCTCPDISTAFNILGSAQANPTVSHMHALKKLLRYLKGPPNMSLTLRGVRTTHSNS
jgi:bifunctional pyridoxal-dependent enzyme with beta-cystathionase and maltose regulon repressor activities